ncbi:dynamin family protein [Yoonia sp. F2084L]|uniref:dynamin family protein n=1 Tax=Yoonia sp. F2084L TaxID=2926419 RepID=UPI001FF48D46|nr:dynamin family protein [Yoonia sp. F2084L]MCK0095856.1 dynamin family protein [Yoonia sp. F2084L]
MKMEELAKGDGYKIPAAHLPFMRLGLEKLDDFHDEVADLEATLGDVVKLGGQDAEKKAAKLIKQLRAFEPSITMIGQIKSGKTSLVNAMVGRPDLLPADVNPWTSVVTSLHLNAPLPEDAPTATFQFFSQGEWDHLVENGGRIGELSERAGADDELEKVRQQIAEMREKTKQRLGRKFELLLGQKHNYAELTDELVQRYVCMGDDFEDMEEDDQQGRFADITKSADLYLEAKTIPMPLCLRDTPGVNDTFMMREQITINALRDSRICVVVLSAHQALSSMDMGLIRLISNVKAREVVIFVNRIDELANPADQVPEIRDSILQTLADNNGPENPQVIFGSAYWANMALAEDLEDIVADSAEAMFNWAEASLSAETSGMDTKELVWHLSGVPELYKALSERISEGPGAEILAASRKRALNLVGGVRASNAIVSMRLDGDTVEVMSSSALAKHLDKLEADNLKFLNDRLDVVFQQFGSRVDQSHKRFLDRALESLLQHLETNGEDEIWQYSPDGLRMLLRTSYQVMRRNVSSTCQQVYAAAATELAETYRSAFGVDVENFTITPPAAPEIPAPVSLGQTIALDLQTSWWKGWWKRRKGYRAFASGFYDLIEAETAPIVDELKVRQSDDIRAKAERELREFLSEQRAILSDIGNKSEIAVDDLEDIFGITAQQEREELFDYIFEELSDNTPADAEGTA